MRRLFVIALAAATLIPAVSGAQPAPQSTPGQTCFFSRDWKGWKATADGKSMYVRTSPNRLFRFDFVGQCSRLNWPMARLITTSRNGLVCSRLDLDIQVSDGVGSAVPCLVDKLSALTPAEAAALPKALTP